MSAADTRPVIPGDPAVLSARYHRHRSAGIRQDSPVAGAVDCRQPGRTDGTRHLRPRHCPAARGEKQGALADICSSSTRLCPCRSRDQILHGNVTMLVRAGVLRTVHLRAARATLSALVEQAARGDPPLSPVAVNPGPSLPTSVNGTAFAESRRFATSTPPRGMKGAAPRRMTRARHATANCSARLASGRPERSLDRSTRPSRSHRLSGELA